MAEFDFLAGKKIGFAVCGSFCTFKKAFAELERLAETGAEVTAIMSFNAASLDTRFGKAAEHIAYLEKITQKKVIKTIEDAEPVGPKKMFDVMIIAPCTGNTLAKLAYGIIDTPVTMAAKSHLRNARPLVIAPSTNDGLSGSAKNIGALLNYKNVYFVPFAQDDFSGKPRSLVADFTQIPGALENALNGIQRQPLLVNY
ncbi:MAG: dipicolinate synthase subunit B [Ruminococcus sp.]|nr:dipicolinate synthase subunit B [Ruminococcus sp.]MCM1381040.1 dipicolinate synthase subunit B [Muribaculaceae bacterium]MCM1479729.1 dipicolinate synthase subunit B [Muribaculaceae bacterium]